MTKVQLVVDPSVVSSRIKEALTVASALLQSLPSAEVDMEEFRVQYLNWTERTEAVLESSFDTHGMFTPSPADEFRRAGLAVLDLQLASTPITAAWLDEVQKDIQAKSRVLQSIRSRLDVYELPVGNNPSLPPKPSGDGPIFLIHGHNLLLREKVRTFVQRICSRPVVVLDDQPNKGRDILGKLLDHAIPASFAIALLTGDDEGRQVKALDWQLRARQNVILELGLFLGLLGRDRVVALYEDGVEMPSDYQGVLWISLADEGWTLRLAREMKAASIQVDLNAAI